MKISPNLDMIEIHYFLPNGCHKMDANIEAQCTLQYVKTVKRIAERLDIEIGVDTIAIAEGGLKHWLKIVKDKEDKEASITSETIKYLVKALSFAAITGAWCMVGSMIKSCNSQSIVKEGLEFWQEHSEDFEEHPAFNADRAGFYKPLTKEPDVEKVEFSAFGTGGSTILSREVSRSEFEKLSKYSQELEPGEDDAAIIQITAPVLTKGKYNTWHGIYNGEQIAFEMLSSEFKTSVQIGDIKFANGTCIKCLLTFTKTLLPNGNIQNSRYKVKRVDKCYDSEHIFETQEGKRHSKKKELDNAPNLFTGFNEGF